ncbi:MAG: cytochrome c family protein [Desulfobacteraceae bacterium]|nr:cytochrome c family protein [Desulfobacteraceae bacterium]
MVVLLFGSILTFSLMCACPIDHGECSKGREPVSFPHDMHMESYDCEVCHHAYDENKNNVLDVDELYSDNPDIMCSSCHASENKINTQEAFHQQCIGCHNEEATLGQAEVPTMCRDCHYSESHASTEYDMIIKGQND